MDFGGKTKKSKEKKFSTLGGPHIDTMSQGELDAAFAHMQARVRAQSKSHSLLPKLPKWSQLTSTQKRGLVIQSSAFMVVGWLVMEHFASRPASTISGGYRLSYLPLLKGATLDWIFC